MLYGDKLIREYAHKKRAQAFKLTVAHTSNYLDDWVYWTNYMKENKN